MAHERRWKRYRRPGDPRDEGVETSEVLHPADGDTVPPAGTAPTAGATR